MVQRYAVAFVGLQRGSGLAAAFAENPRTQVAALCDLDAAQLAVLGAALDVPDHRRYQRYEDLLNTPVDAVVLATPIALHAPQAIAALAAGKHVLSEVTAAATLEQCAALAEAVQRSGRVYMMAENCCYFHFVRCWREWFREGRFGSVFHAEAEYIHAIPELIWDKATGQRRWRAQRPPLHYCSHSLGPLLDLMQDRIAAATGAGSGYDILPEHVGPGAMNMQVALFRTHKGATIKLLRSSVARREPPMHFYSLYGTRGFIENGREGGWTGSCGRYHIDGETDVAVSIPCPISDPQAPPEAQAGGHGTAEYHMVQDFVAALDGAAPPPIGIARALDFTVPGIVAHEAAQRGVWLDVPTFA